MRDEIIKEIRRLSASTGQAPGQMAFTRDTGIQEHQWRGKHWARWSDALVEAGFEPNVKTSALDREAVLTTVIRACRHYGRVPTRDELDLLRQSDTSVPSSNAIARHLGGRLDMIEALRIRVDGDPSFEDVAAILPEPTMRKAEKVAVPRPEDGNVYLIRSGAYYKIGRSDDLERRVKEIRIALPDKATLVHTIRTDDPAGIEAYWHRRFADRRANGEWFKLSAMDVSAFRKRKYQ
jgi:Meiotically up-regulated gene 113